MEQWGQAAGQADLGWRGPGGWVRTGGPGRPENNGRVGRQSPVPSTELALRGAGNEGKVDGAWMGPGWGGLTSSFTRA